MFPDLAKKTKELAIVNNWIYSLVSFYASYRGEFPEGYVMWLTVEVPDQIKLILKYDRLTIDGDGKTTKCLKN